MIKKKNIFSMNLSKKAVVVLQVLGYLDGNKKSKRGKSMSLFISNLVEDFIIFHKDLNEAEINLKVFKNEIFELEQLRKIIETKMRHAAEKISTEREILKAKQ